MPAHFITGMEPGRSRVESILGLADDRKQQRTAAARPLSGARIGALYLNPSLRTRASFAAAVQSLGADFLEISSGSDMWSLESTDGAVMSGHKSEHARDAAKVLSRYVDLLGLRSFSNLNDPEEDLRDGVARAFARHAEVPIVNLESGMAHPCQALSDVFTLREQLGTLEGVPLVLHWTPHPQSVCTAIPNSMLKTAAQMGMNVTVAHPEGWGLADMVVQEADAQARESGGAVRVTHDRSAALRGARVVYACSWSGGGFYGRRVEESQRKQLLGDWCISEASLAETDDARLMHPLPVRRNVEVTDEVLDGPRSLIYDQAENRVHVQAALLLAQLGLAREVQPW